jgi:hypothetical protein
MLGLALMLQAAWHADAVPNPSSLSQLGSTTKQMGKSMSKAVKELSEEIEELKDAIDETEMEAEGDISSTAITLNKALDPIETLKEESESNAAKSKTESEMVTTSVGVMSSAGTEALNQAKSILESQSTGEAKQESLLDDVKYGSSGAIDEMKMSSDISLQADAAEFNGQLKAAENFADSEGMKFEQAMDKLDMGKDSTLNKLEGKIELFDKNEDKWVTDSKDMVKEGKKMIKGMSKTLKKDEKSLTKDIQKASKLLIKVPAIIPKELNTKSFDKHLAKTDKQVNKDMESMVKSLDKEVSGNLKDAAKDYSTLTKTITTGKEKVMKQLSELEKGDSKDTDAWRDTAKDLGKNMKALAKEIRNIGSGVDKTGNEVRTDVREAEREMTAEVKALADKVEKDADERGPETQAEIDSASAQASAMIGQSTTDLAGTIAESTDELDQKVQSASMALSGPLAEAEAHVNKDKTLSASLASQSAGSAAQVASASMQAEKIQKTAEDEATKAQIAMNLALQELDMGLKFGEQQYGILAEGEMEALSQKLGGMVGKLEQPVWIHLSGILREIGEVLSNAKLDQGNLLEELEDHLKDIYSMLQRNTGDNDFIDVTVPKLLTETDRRMSGLKTGVDSLNTDRITMKQQVEKMAGLSVMGGINWVNEQLEKIRRGVRDNLKDRSHTYFDNLAGLMRNVKNLMGDNVANSQEMKDMQAYLKSKLVALQEGLTEAEEREDAQVESTDKQVDAITGTKLVEMSTIGSRSTSASADAIGQAIDNQRQKELDDLNAKESGALGTLQEESQKTTNKMQSQETLIENSMAKSFDTLQDALNSASYKATQINTGASTATQQFLAAVAAIQRGASSAGESAARMSDDLQRSERYLTTTLQSDKERDSEEMADAIKSVARAMAGMRSRESDKIDGLLSGITKKNKELAAGWESRLKDGQREVHLSQESVQNARRSAEASEERAKDQFQQLENEVGSDLEKMQLEERSSEEGARDDADGLEKSRGSLSKQNEAILYTLQENADDASSTREAKSSEMLSKLEARVKTVKTENEAAYAGVQAALQNAASAQGRDQADILEAERMLWEKSHKLYMHREEYENQTAVKIKTFSDLVANERASLEENRGYLDKYERYTHWQQMNLLELAIELLNAEVKGADGVFDRMEKHEEAFGEEVSHMMNGEEFQTLRKIYDADMYVQKATREDEDMVKRLEDHEKGALPWMQRVLLALDAAHDEMVAKTEEQGAEQHNLDEEAAKRTGGTLDFLSNMVEKEGGGGAPTDELGQMTSAAVAKMQEQQAAMSDNEQGSINALKRQANQMTDDANAEIGESQFKFKQIQGVIGTTSGAVADLEDVVKQVSAQRDKQIAAEKKAVKDKANTLIQKVLFKEDDSTADLFGDSLLEKSTKKGSRLDKLLKQNKVLRQLNKGLDSKHAELGQEVQQVASLVQQLRKD